MNTILVTGWKEDPGHTTEYVLEGERIRAILGIGQRIVAFHIHGLPILGYRGPAVISKGAEGEVAGSAVEIFHGRGFGTLKNEVLSSCPLEIWVWSLKRGRV